MIGKGFPTGMGDYPHDPEPTPVCATCGSDDITYFGGEHGYCRKCDDNCVVMSDDEYLATHPEDAVAQAVAREVGKP